MQESSQINTILIVASLAPVLLCLLFLAIFIAFNQRKNKLLQQQERAKLQFQQELNNTRIEIKDDTLKRVAHELHDNVGQLLSLAKIYLVGLKETYSNESKIKETDALLEKALFEIRTLSKLINADWAKQFSLVEGLQQLCIWIERTDRIQTKFTFSSDENDIRDEEKIILFRICQEFINNSMKYAHCNQIHIQLNSTTQGFSLLLSDNGIGFDKKQIQVGSGLSNFEQRAFLINASCELSSAPGKGTQLSIQKNNLV